MQENQGQKNRQSELKGKFVESKYPSEKKVDKGSNRNLTAKQMEKD